MRFALVTVALIVLAACEGMPGPDAGPSGRFVLPEAPYNYAAPNLPLHFETTGLGLGESSPLFDLRDRTPEDNPVTDHGATLGRVLFFDTLLSQNETIACGSCHDPTIGFSDPRPLSIGFEDGETGRHSMGLANARYSGNGRFFWDERAAILEEQVLMPIQDEVEMGMTLDEVVERVAAQDDYAPLFASAFGDDEVTSDRMSLALAQFVRSIMSFSAPYDEGRVEVGDPRTDFDNFTDEQNLGKRLFFSRLDQGGFDCVACHQGEAMATPLATSNGLDLETTDPGLGGFTMVLEDEGRFRVPSLRNVAVRPPYMHDGRFADLDEVLDHYSTGIQNHPALTVYKTLEGGARRLDFTDEQHAALKAFLQTLTDPGMLDDERYQDPFVNR